MKKQIDINSYVKQAEENAFINLKKDSYTRYSHKFIHFFLDFFKEKIDELNFDLGRANQDNFLILSNREQYTVKKESLELMMANIFGVENKDFLTSSEIIKVTGQDESIFSNYLNKNEKAFITFNIMPMDFLKLSKSSKIIDTNYGDTYQIKDQFQEPIYLDYPCTIDDIKFSIKYPLYLNSLIVSK